MSSQILHPRFYILSDIPCGPVGRSDVRVQVHVCGVRAWHVPTPRSVYPQAAARWRSGAAACSWHMAHGPACVRRTCRVCARRIITYVMEVTRN